MAKTPIQDHSCPHCHSPRIVRLPHASDASSSTDYFRCASCGHLWNAPKSKENDKRRPGG